MRNPVLLSLVLLTHVLSAGAVFGSDDGQTQPRLNSGYTVYPNDYFEVVPSTNGSGNVKGIRCLNGVPVLIKIYVNGGSAQTLTFEGGQDVLRDSQWAPMNVRFSSSVRVRMERPGSLNGDDGSVCFVSWGLD
jgi:hypothetical protein